MKDQQTTEKTSGKSQRLEARVSAEQKELFTRAAAIQGSTLTEFVVRNLQEAAVRAIKDQERLELGSRDREVFIESLLGPPEPGERLRDAAAKYREIMDV